MFEDRNPKFDVVALALGAGTLFLALSLTSYDRMDPPGGLVWPPAETVANACGMVGANTAHTLFEMLGVGAYYLVLSLGLVVGLLFTRHEINQPFLRATGWVMSLVGIATIATLIIPSWSPGPMIGAGGYIGAMGQSWLESHFASAGSLLFAFSLLLAGLLLSSDYFVFQAAAATATATATASGATLATAGKLSQAATQRFRPSRLTDLDGSAAQDAEEEEVWEEEGAEEEDADEELADDEEWVYEEVDEDAEEDTEEDAEEEDSEATAKGLGAMVGGLGKQIASALKVKTPDEPVEEEEAEEAAQQDDDEEKPAKFKSSGPKLKKPKTKSEREEIIRQLEAADQEANFDSDYELPPIDLLIAADDVSYDEHEKEIRRKAKILEKTFANFGFNVKVVEVETGPVIAQYEVELEPGLRLSKITGLSDDLAIALRVPSVRIVAPIPGKNTVGIEAPNDVRQIVRLREVIEETGPQTRRMKIPIFMGKDVSGNPMVVDLASLPHLLIAGRTGTGKSVCLNSIIASILMTRGPDEVRMLMIDPKMVELSGYRKLPHLMHPVVTDMRKAEAILSWSVDKMEERYMLLARAGVRHLSVYNQLSEQELRERLESADGQPMDEATWGLVPKQLPYIVIVADEIADLMMTAGKDAEQHIIRLAQKSRAVGIHLILATQKPTVDVITGLIKSNLPARIAFQVASRTDSRVVLDEMGADKLLGNGDMLFLSPGTSMLLRGQGTFLSDDEINRVVDFVGTDDQQFAAELMQIKTKEEKEESEGASGKLKNRDDLYEAAVDVVVRERRGSVSLLQRCLSIGYGRAARLIDFMAEDGIVGEYNGSQAREILLTVEEWEVMSGDAEESTEETPAKPKPKPKAKAKTPAPPAEEVAEEVNEEVDAEEDTEESELADDEEWVYEEEDAEEDTEESEEEADGEENEEEAELADDEEWVYEEEDSEEGAEESEEEDLAESA